MATVNELCEETDVSYRQGNTWISKGYIPDIHPVGSGYPLSLNGKQSLVFRVMATLVKTGMLPKQASEIANDYANTEGVIVYNKHYHTPTHAVVVSVSERLSA